MREESDFTKDFIGTVSGTNSDGYPTRPSVTRSNLKRKTGGKEKSIFSRKSIRFYLSVFLSKVKEKRESAG